MATLLPPQPLIEVKGLNHFYGPPPGGHLVLENVDLTLYRTRSSACSAAPARASPRCCARSPA
jgi:hypothetical protein